MKVLTSLEEAKEITAVRLTEKRQVAKVGDLFRLCPEPGVLLWGRLIKRATFFGQSCQANLIYIYDSISAERPLPEQLKPTHLLLGPAVVNNLGWSRGYWQLVASEPLLEDDVLERHLFVKFAGSGKRSDYRVVDEHGDVVRDWRFWRRVDASRLMQAGYSNFNHLDWLIRGILEERGTLPRR